MKEKSLFKTKKFNSEFVPFPMSRFDDGHILITEGIVKTPVCILPMPMGKHVSGIERQEKNAEMIRRLPDFLDVVVDIVCAKRITDEDLKKIQTKLNKLLKY